MEIMKTDNIGFCFGVKRAIDVILKTAGNTDRKVYTLGPVIHNPQIVDMLKQKGVFPVTDIREITDGIVVLRTHGVEKQDEVYAKNQGLTIIDATCPFVKRVRRHAVDLEKKGYQVVIVGDERHPEVKSVLSYLNNDGIVLQFPTSIEAKKLGVVSQTTLDIDTFSSVVQGLVGGTEELRVYNTICESTRSRKKEAFLLAQKVDVMLIVGGKNSANTAKLFDIAKKAQPNTYHIETEEELKRDWFHGKSKVGITGGASTPDFIIESVERHVKNF